MPASLSARESLFVCKLGGISVFTDVSCRVRMNVDLLEKECSLPPFDAAERRAMRQARRAEEEFRRSKGYPPNTFW